MYQNHEVDAIRAVADALPRDTPAPGILERLAQVASEGWNVASLCLEIDALKKNGKLIRDPADHITNESRATALKDLMVCLDGDDLKARTRRAYALRLINKLRG
jgi:hypothetical protein